MSWVTYGQAAVKSGCALAAYWKQPNQEHSLLQLRLNFKQGVLLCLKVRGHSQKVQADIILESDIICCTLSTSGGGLLESAFSRQGLDPFSCVIVDEVSAAVANCSLFHLHTPCALPGQPGALWLLLQCLWLACPVQPRGGERSCFNWFFPWLVRCCNCRQLLFGNTLQPWWFCFRDFQMVGLYLYLFGELCIYNNKINLFVVFY